jgi:hypothetical protein
VTAAVGEHRERASAVRRLVGKWLEVTGGDALKASCLPLSHILTEDNIEATRKLDFYPEFDERPTRRRAWAVADQLRQQRARNQQLVRAWLQDPRARVLQ